MGLKYLKRQLLEKCPPGCNGRIISKNKGIYCKHIESKLPKYTRNSINAVNDGKHIETYSQGVDYAHKGKLTTDQIEQKLKEYGLGEYEVELLMSRYIDGKTLKQIVKEQGWTSPGSAVYHLNMALKKLRKTRFNFNE